MGNRAIAILLAAALALLGADVSALAKDRSDHAAGTTVTESGQVALVMSGTIGPGSFRQFRRALRRAKPDLIVLEGPGGVLGEAILIAEEVRRRGLATVVGPDASCASACAIVFLAGRTKYMGRRAKVGLHAASFIGGEADPEATDVMALYLGQLGVPANTLRRMAMTPPHDIRWLSSAEQRALGIRRME
jgi:hypothetical protein